MISLYNPRSPTYLRSKLLAPSAPRAPPTNRYNDPPSFPYPIPKVTTHDVLQKFVRMYQSKHPRTRFLRALFMARRPLIARFRFYSSLVSPDCYSQLVLDEPKVSTDQKKMTDIVNFDSNLIDFVPENMPVDISCIAACSDRSLSSDDCCAAGFDGLSYLPEPIVRKESSDFHLQDYLNIIGTGDHEDHMSIASLRKRRREDDEKSTDDSSVIQSIMADINSPPSPKPCCPPPKKSFKMRMAKPCSYDDADCRDDDDESQFHDPLLAMPLSEIPTGFDKLIRPENAGLASTNETTAGRVAVTPIKTMKRLFSTAEFNVSETHSYGVPTIPETANETPPLAGKQDFKLCRPRAQMPLQMPRKSTIKRQIHPKHLLSVGTNASPTVAHSQSLSTHKFHLQVAENPIKLNPSSPNTKTRSVTSDPTQKTSDLSLPRARSFVTAVTPSRDPSLTTSRPSVAVTPPPVMRRKNGNRDSGHNPDADCSSPSDFEFDPKTISDSKASILKFSRDMNNHGSDEEPERDFARSKDEHSKKKYHQRHVATWMLRYQEAKEFAKAHGHCVIPNHYPSNTKLGRWAKRQRCQYQLWKKRTNGPCPVDRNSSLSNERIKALKAISFCWNHKEHKWRERYQELLAYIQEHGHAGVKTGDQDCPELATWVKVQRRQYRLMSIGKSSSMSPERMEILEKVSFVMQFISIFAHTGAGIH